MEHPIIHPTTTQKGICSNGARRVRIKIKYLINTGRWTILNKLHTPNIAICVEDPIATPKERSCKETNELG